jgi:hypothetical protein
MFHFTEPLCKECKLKIKIIAVEPEDEEIMHIEDCRKVLRKQEKIILQRSIEIRSWSDLFQVDDKHAMYLNGKEQELLK